MATKQKKPATKSTKVIVLVRPDVKKKIPWWPKEKNKYLWATIDYTGGSYRGYTMGRDKKLAMPEKSDRRYLAMADFVEEKVGEDATEAQLTRAAEAWEFRIEHVK